MNDVPEYSIVLPAKDEAENLTDVISEIAGVMPAGTYEVIVIDDGSSDATGEIVCGLMRDRPWLRLVGHDKSCGKSAAILTGVQHARARLIATLDADGQNDPRYLAPLLALVADPAVGVAAGQRVKHAHSPMKQWGSKLANGLRSSLLGDHTRDTACGLKAFPRDVFLRLPYFDTMHRFLPALVMREGLEVRHLDVLDRPRRHGVSKYGVIDRALVGIPDLLGVWWLFRRRRRLPRSQEMSDRP